jgi:hypothetical protein
MRHVRLIAVSDEYDTAPGFALKGAPVQVEGFAADRDGVLIAHDLLEHVNGREHIGTVWDELEALGAIWQVRGRHGDLLTHRASSYSPQQNLAADLVRMFPEWGAEGAPPKAHLIKRTRACDHDNDLLDVIEYARRDIPREYDDCDRLEMECYLEEALHRMRNGYRKARRKYGDGYTGANLFCAVRDAIKGGYPPEVEGIEYTLSYDLHGGHLTERYDY